MGKCQSFLKQLESEIENRNVDKDAEQLKLFCTVGESVRWKTTLLCVFACVCSIYL